MAITYPVDCVTSEQRWRFLESFQELLRLVHNVLGLWYREGITRDEYDNGILDSRIGETRGELIIIPPVIKNLVPYTPKLSEARWNTFVQWHMSAVAKIDGQRKIHLRDARSDRTWPHDFNDLN